jgi:hypothetical protein
VPAEPTQPGWFAFSASGYFGELRLYDVPQVDNQTPTGSGIAIMGGLHASAIAHARNVYGGLSVVYEGSLTHFEGANVSLWRPGVVLGWGAPYGDGWLGASATGGLVYSYTSQTANEVSGSVSPTSGGSGTVSPPQTVRQDWNTMQYFGELALHAKLPQVFGQQPFASVSAAWVAKSSLFAPKSMVGLELGVVWND